LSTETELIWLSHLGTEYEVSTVGKKRFVKLKNEAKTFDWDNCTVQISRSPLKKLRLFVRGHSHRYSDYKEKIVRPTFFLTIDIDSITQPTESEYQVGIERKELRSLHHKRYRRYVFGLDNRYWIWEWSKNYDDIKQSKIYLIYTQIIEYLENLHKKPSENTNLITASFLHTDKDSVPAIYQPAIDQLKNFVREIHCCKIFYDEKCFFIEVSIMFNNEQLRRHKVLNQFYEKFRLFFYGRIIDVESFRIYSSTAQTDKPYFTFDRIYSENHGIEEDNIHGDRDLSVPKKRYIYTYFADNFHPVVFINTSNHAMAEKDNNVILWKWEYRPFDDKSPVIFGTKSRHEIDSQFMPVPARILRKVKSKICSYLSSNSNRN
jgi:hypothetical protein